VSKTRGVGTDGIRRERLSWPLNAYIGLLGRKLHAPSVSQSGSRGFGSQNPWIMRQHQWTMGAILAEPTRSGPQSAGTLAQFGQRQAKKLADESSNFVVRRDVPDPRGATHECAVKITGPRRSFDRRASAKTLWEYTGGSLFCGTRGFAPRLLNLWAQH